MQKGYIQTKKTRELGEIKRKRTGKWNGRMKVSCTIYVYVYINIYNYLPATFTYHVLYKNTQLPVVLLQQWHNYF